MRFLCQQHRQTVISSVDSALYFWQQWVQQGDEHFKQQQWSQAARFLGCSFEVAEWLLQQATSQPYKFKPQELNPTSRYMLAGHQLAESLGRSGDHDLELHYLLTVHTTLLSQIKNKIIPLTALKHYLEISLAMLKRYCQHCGQFKGYHDCYLETRLCIDQTIEPNINRPIAQHINQHSAQYLH